MANKLDILDPYTCDRELCPNYCIAMQRDISEDDAVRICQSAMKRYTSSDEDLAIEAMTAGVTCGLYLAEQHGEQVTPAES